MYNTDNLFNFCFVYQLHFNSMKQIIDPYPEQVTHAENLLLQFKIQRFKVANN
jgi:hypothetical protein